MFNILKKKNKFDFLIYILFLFFIIFFTKFSTSVANANTYKIVDLEISKPYDNNFNKEVVIDEAFEKAFEQIILKITTLESNDIINLKNLKTIYSLVESFSIVDEKFIEMTGLSKSLTPSRANGFLNIFLKMRSQAKNLSLPSSNNE